MNRISKSYGNTDQFKFLLLFTVVNLFTVVAVNGQSYNRLNGTVRDSLNRPVPEATVEIVAGQDTLMGNTDYRGKFNINGIRTTAVSVFISAMGFEDYQRNYKFGPSQRTITIQAFLDPDANTLKEVVIKANVNPIRIAIDTIEYNAAAYLVTETDRVEDLLKQLPGVTIDKDGRVIAMGKPLTKLRINGEDFFTNNVREFISQLPADMVAKVQVINDYGDEANFTGVKTGNAEKMLNLVTKPGRSKGNFGNTSINGGTNERYGLQTNANLWREKKQIGVKGNVVSTNSAAGLSRNINTGINYRDKLSESVTGTLAYAFDNVDNNVNQLDYIETINYLGTINTIDSNQRNTNSNKHNLNWGLQSIGDKSYFQAGFVGSFLNTDNYFTGNSTQRGVIWQDQRNANLTALYSPEFNIDVAWAYRLTKPGRNFSMGVSAKNGIANTDEALSSSIGYYDNKRIKIPGDSLLNRLVDTRNRSRNLGGSFRFSEPVGNSGDSSVSRNMDVYYNFQLEENDNKLTTRVNNNLFNSRLVDSLSTNYTSRFLAHLIGLSYRYGAEDISYSMGITAQPNLLVVENESPKSRVQHAGFNVAPVMNLSVLLSPASSANFNYSGNSTAPNLAQLQPVPNTRNLQNVVIGNPNLQSTFTHNASFSYQNNNPKNGRALMLGLNSNYIQDQVVSNIVLIQDTLNSLKQETRFENANGGYGIDALYSWSRPLLQNQVNLEFRGSVGFANNVSYTDNILNNNKGFNLSQSIMFRYNQKGFTISSDVNYTYNSNRYSLALANLKDIQVYEFNLNARAFITPTLAVILDASKRINEGYSVMANNPFLMNISLQKTFLKKEQAMFKLQAYDLFNEGNNLMRRLSDNSIIDSKNSQATQFVQISFIINLQQFGG